MIEARGRNGQIEFDGQWVTITRKGFLARTTIGKGEKRLHVSQIAAVQWKPAGLSNGFIQFTVPGGIERRSRFGSQTKTALKDENSVVFTRGRQKKFEEVRSAIELSIAASSRPAPSYAPQPTATDELAKLGQMYQQGLLSPEEFAAAKARFLGA
jgi:hypothetical protein